MKPQYVVRKIYCDPFSHVMDRCQFTGQLQQQRISFNNEACTIAFTLLGRANMIAHAQWPLCLPFPYSPPFLRYTGPPSWAPLVPVLSFLRHGNVVTFGAVSYGRVICLYF